MKASRRPSASTTPAASHSRPIWRRIRAGIAPTFAIAVLAVAAQTTAIGAVSTWDSDGNPTIGVPPASTPGSGTWNSSNVVWNTGGSGTDSAWVAGNDAVFAGSDGTYAITVGGTLAVGNLTFSNSGYTLSASSTAALSNTVGNNTVSVIAGGTATIGSNVNFTNGFNNGLVSLVGSGSASSATGTLIIDNGGKVSTTFGTSAIIYIGSITNSGTVKATTVQVNTGGIISSTNSVAVNGLLKVEGGTVTAGNGLIAIGNYADTNIPAASILTINSGTVNATASGVRFGTNTSQNNTGGTLNLNGGTLNTSKIFSGGTSNSSTVNFNGGILKASGSNNTDFLGTAAVPIKNAIVKAGGANIDTNFNVTVFSSLTHDSGLGATADGGLTKSGSGTLTLSASNSYTGVTTVSAGTILISGSGTLGAGSITVSGSGAILDLSAITSSTYSLTSTQTLGGIGKVTLGAKTLAMSGTLSAGITTGTLTVDGGTLSLNSSTKFKFDLGTLSDQILLTNSAVLSLGSGVVGFSDFTFTNSGGLASGSYTLISGASSLSGTLDAANLTGTVVPGFNGTLGLSGNNLVLTVIPEPSTLAMALGGIGLLALVRRRK